jgi:hypothetical protein
MMDHRVRDRTDARAGAGVMTDDDEARILCGEEQAVRSTLLGQPLDDSHLWILLAPWMQHLLDTRHVERGTSATAEQQGRTTW